MKYTVIIPLLAAVIMGGCATPIDKKKSLNPEPEDTELGKVQQKGYSTVSMDDGQPKSYDTAKHSEAEMEVAVTDAPIHETGGKTDLPMAVRVTGKKGLVHSPFSEAGLVDVAGIPPGTRVVDPYTSKKFIVPPE